MLALYRKYRPQVFKEIIGQDPIITTLKNEIKNNRISHAYIFSGPRGTGKTTVARIFAKSINCLKQKDGEPCNQCQNCQLLNQNKTFDLIEIDAASNRGINEIRELKERVKFPPSNLKYKVFIIDEVHMLTPEAFNALLKTLEEPPEFVIFILATTEIYKVPSTIVSRCQRFDFKRIPTSEIKKRLKNLAMKEGVEIEDSILQEIARRSEGCMRDGESILSQVLSLGEKRINKEMAEIFLPKSYFNYVLEFSNLIFKGNKKQALEYLDNLYDNGVNLKQFNSDLIEFLRQLLLSKMGINVEKLKEDIGQENFDFFSKIEIDKIIKSIEEFIQAQLKIDSSEIPQLPLELAVIEINKT